jgi:cytoskeletal protein CcmA (bactofilin family)
MEAKQMLRFGWTQLAALVLLTVITFGLVGSAQAVEFIEGEFIAADEVIDDDVFIAGQNVVVDGTINGNLFVAGSTVTVNGQVNGSLFAGGQNVAINGAISGSLFVAASALDLGATADVERNLFFGGFSVSAERGSQVHRDALIGGYQALLAGEVGRDVLAGVAALELTGRVGGDVSAEVGTPSQTAFPSFWGPPGAPPMVSPGLRIGSNAQIEGELNYTSPVEQDEAIDAQPEGGVVFATPQPDRDERPRVQPRVDLGIFRWLIDRLRDLVTLLILGGLGLWLLPELFSQAVELARTQTLPATAWGLLIVIGGYVLAATIAVTIFALGILLGIVTLGGLAGTVFGVGLSSLGVAFSMFTLLINYGSKALVAFLGGKWLLERISPENAESKVFPLVLGVLIYVLLRAIPLLGWLLAVFVTLLGMGAFWLLLRERQVLRSSSEA